MKTKPFTQYLIPQWLAISLLLTVINLLILGSLFSLAHQLDPIQPPQWVGYLLNGAWIFFGLIVVLVAQIDAVIRIQDYWYYIAAIFNGFIWANLIMYISVRYRILNKLFR
jgi:hypothetical protein